MVSERAAVSEWIRDLRGDIDGVLQSFLTERRRTVETIDAAAVPLVDEIMALVNSGGKRLRPLFCVCGFRATGAAIEGPVLKAAAAMELLHTMALIHDDVMDASEERRGQPSAEARQVALARERGVPRPELVGRSVAILAGDVSAVLADDLLLGAGFPSDRLTAALEPYHRMRLEMAVGQFVDVVGVGTPTTARDLPALRRAAALRGGSYTVRGPLLVGAALAGAKDGVVRTLERFAEPLGEAFQLADDLADGDAPPGVDRGVVEDLVRGARAGLDPQVLHADAIEVLTTLAATVAAPADPRRDAPRRETTP